MLLFVILCVTLWFFVPKLISIGIGAAAYLLIYFIFLQGHQIKLDPLTKAYNRASFELEIKRTESAKNAVIVVFDINRLKYVNDRFGHLKGDYIIVDAYRKIEKCFLPYGKIYRIGGDEFCAICVNAAEIEIADAVGKLNETAKENFSEDFPTVSISCGYESYRAGHGEILRDVIAEADKKMYEHKKGLNVCRR
jgi:diguanylate cyclase (GGDEF)-like protein